MSTPWFIYVVLLFLIIIAFGVMVFASIDPEGRGGNVAKISLYLALALCVVLAILVVLDLVRWNSTS